MGYVSRNLGVSIDLRAPHSANTQAECSVQLLRAARPHRAVLAADGAARVGGDDGNPPNDVAFRNVYRIM